MKKNILFVLVLMLSFGFAVVVNAIPTYHVTVQGRLTDSNGQAIPNKTILSFGVRVSGTAGTPFSISSVSSAPIKTDIYGVFNAELDLSAVILSGLPEYSLFVGQYDLVIGTDTATFSQPLTASPYAIRAKYADSATTATDSTKVLKAGDTMTGSLLITETGTLSVNSRNVLTDAIQGVSEYNNGVTGIANYQSARLAGVEGRARKGFGVLGRGWVAGVRGEYYPGIWHDAYGNSWAYGDLASSVVIESLNYPNSSFTGVYGLSIKENGAGVAGVASGASNAVGVIGVSTNWVGVQGFGNMAGGKFIGRTSSSYGIFVNATKSYFDGKVGIGTFEPTASLEVNGTSTFNGDVKINGNLKMSSPTITATTAYMGASIGYRAVAPCNSIAGVVLMPASQYIVRITDSYVKANSIILATVQNDAHLNDISLNTISASVGEITDGAFTLKCSNTATGLKVAFFVINQ